MHDAFGFITKDENGGSRLSAFSFKLFSGVSPHAALRPSKGM